MNIQKYEVQSPHKFELGTRVSFTHEVALPDGEYEIVALLPVDREGIWQYRLRNVGKGHERVAREFQLTARS